MNKINKYNDSDVGRYERIEAQLFDGDTELGELTLVCFDHVGVSLSDLLEFGLYFLNSLVFKVFDLLESALDYSESLGIYLCSG